MLHLALILPSLPRSSTSAAAYHAGGEGADFILMQHIR